MKKTVLITGSTGFIGKNLKARILTNNEYNILTFDKNDDIRNLEMLVEKSDFIFHIAGVNRPSNDNDFVKVNTNLTKDLIKHIKKCKKKIPVVITSSQQAELQNPYGVSKLEAENALIEWSDKTTNPVCIFRLPNVFGKWSKPNYNSVVSTFCHNIVTGKKIDISDPEKIINFVYIDDVTENFYNLLKSELNISKKYYDIPRIFTTTLQELADRIFELNNVRKTLKIPDLSDRFNKYLYATLTSFYETDDFSHDLQINGDERGWLAEFIKSESAGQVFISSTNQGYTRGNHWHNTKVEKFLVVSGEGRITLRKYETDEIIVYPVSDKKLTVVDMPTGYIHAIKNIGKKDLITLFWSSEILNKSEPDTYFEEV